MIFVIFSVYTMNPLSLRVSCVICVMLSVFHVILTVVVAAVQPKAPGQFGALDTEHPGVLAREVLHACVLPWQLVSCMHVQLRWSNATSFDLIGC